MSVMLKVDVAVNYANTLGIYASSVRVGNRIFWQPRLADHQRPGPEVMKKAPSAIGFWRWEDAVLALGDHLTGKEPTNAADTEG